MRKQASPTMATGPGPGSVDAGEPAGSPMEKARVFLRRYPVVALTLLVLLATLVLVQFGLELQVRILASAYAAVIVVARAAGMVRSLREGRWGIDLLALMAIASTVAVGEYLAALVVILMLTGGEALENFAQGRAARELRSLLDRAPRFAHREESGGALVDTPIGEVAPGDILVVRPSELVPVDGELLSDSASLDESSLTGESLPVERTRGQQLLSGAVNRLVAAAMTGRTPKTRGVLYLHDVDAIELRTDRPLPLQVDGEDLGDVDRAEFSSEPRAAKILR